MVRSPHWGISRKYGRTGSKKGAFRRKELRISVLTIAPDEFNGFLSGHILRRATELKALQIDIVDIREYADGCFRHIDEKYKTICFC